MYHFGRGPLMALILQHPDDILCRQLQFLRMPLVASVVVMAPCLYDVRLDDTGAPAMERVRVARSRSPSACGRDLRKLH